MSRDPADILTPQGKLRDIMQRPNLDVVMNLFKIPRAFAVSGFGDWTVGQHSFCVAYLALYWSAFRGYGDEIRDRLIVAGLTHDLHESATGDILPALKTTELRAELDTIQERFLKGLCVSPDPALKADLKALDRIAFLYEIRCTAVINAQQRTRLAQFFAEQKAMLCDFCTDAGFENVELFLAEMGITDIETGSGL